MCSRTNCGANTVAASDLVGRLVSLPPKLPDLGRFVTEAGGSRMEHSQCPEHHAAGGFLKKKIPF